LRFAPFRSIYSTFSAIDPVLITRRAYTRLEKRIFMKGENSTFKENSKKAALLPEEG